MEKRGANISKERLAGVLLFVLVGFAMASIVVDAMVQRVGAGTSRHISNPLSAGTAAPAFELESLTGETVALAGLEGKPVLIMFWGSS